MVQCNVSDVVFAVLFSARCCFAEYILFTIPRKTQLLICMVLQRLLNEQQKLELLDDTRKYKNISMASESASIHMCLMSGFLTYTFTKLEVVLLCVLCAYVLTLYFLQISNVGTLLILAVCMGYWAVLSCIGKSNQ